MSSESQQRNSLAKNILVNWGAFFCNITLGLLIAPLIIRGLGQELYGLWAILVGVTGQFALLDFGLRTSLARFTARYSHDHAESSHADLFETSRLLYIALSFLAVILGAGIIIFLPNLNLVPATHLGKASIVLFLLLLDAAFELIAGQWEGTLAGFEKYPSIARANLWRMVTYGALACGMYLVGGGIITLALVLLLSRLVQRLFLNISYRRILARQGIVGGHASLITAKALITFGGWASIAFLSARLIHTIDTVVAGTLLGITAAALYAVPALITEQLRYVVQLGITVLTPRFSKLHSLNHHEQVKNLWHLVLRLGQPASFMVVTAVLCSGEMFLTLWAGGSYAKSDAILCILVVPFIFTLPGLTFLAVQYATGEHRKTATLLLLESITNLALSIILARQLGIVGVALGTLLPALIFRGLILNYWALKFFSESVSSFIQNIFLIPLIPALAQALSCLLILEAFSFHPSWVTWIVANTLSVSVFFGVSWVLLIKGSERPQVLEYIKALFPGLKRH